VELQSKQGKSCHTNAREGDNDEREHASRWLLTNQVLLGAAAG
jgi:hypothetical protein